MLLEHRILGKLLSCTDRFSIFHWNILKKELDLFMLFDIITYCPLN